MQSKTIEKILSECDQALADQAEFERNESADARAARRVMRAQIAATTVARQGTKIR